jgi:predicted nucleic acid-binding protein
VFAALLDTNVIWPSLRRDFLLSMAIEGLYRPLWSEQILAELHHHEAKKLAGRGQRAEQARADADHLIREMRRAFSDAIVAGWDPLVGTHGLPDPDDEHVLAAAVIGGAGAIVTENAKHFPVPPVPRHIQVLSAAEFARDAVSVDPAKAIRALEEMSRRRRQAPRQTPREIVDILVLRYQMHEAAEILREAFE